MVVGDNSFLEVTLRGGESEVVEFKESLDSEAIESVNAFANTRGGTMFVGVADNATVKGVTLGKETLRDWANHIAQATHVHPRFSILNVQGRTVVAIDVPESAVKPVACQGRYFRRVAKSNRQVTDDDLTRVVLSKAVCHRDYLSTGHVEVRWYEDRLVLFNPGGLPSPLRVEDLKRIHPSVPRNRKIVEVFFNAGLIEQWGSGIPRMVEACAKQGLPEPEFEEAAGGLWLAFRRDRLTESYLRSLGLSDRQIRAVQEVRGKGRITNLGYQQLFVVSKRTASRELAELAQKDILVQVGATGKGTFYSLK